MADPNHVCQLYEDEYPLHCDGCGDSFSALSAIQNQSAQISSLNAELVRLRLETQNARDTIYALAAEIAKARETEKALREESAKLGGFVEWAASFADEENPEAMPNGRDFARSAASVQEEVNADA